MEKRTIRKEEINKIMIVYNDNDFVRVFDWIGKVALMTLNNNTNICGGKVLEDSKDIEEFIKSLIPTGIEFIQYKEDKYAKFCRYKELSKEDVKRLFDSFEDVKFKYNFKEEDENWIFGGSETLIIDILNNKSYIR